MSDSEDDLTEMMVVSAHGPGFNISNKITNFSSNVFSSTQMPRIFERQRYAESEYGQSNSYRRRETSPMSIMSACDMRRRNYNNSLYSRNQGVSKRSILIRRGASPMSVRSMGTMASQMSVVDIVDYLRNERFSERDMREISRAYRILKRNHRSRGPHRRRIPWSNRDARVRRRSGYDSGGQASNSSLSNSDDNSIKGSTYKENMSSCRSTRTDISEYRNTQNYNRSRFRPNVNAMTGINLNSTQTSVSSYRTNISSSMPTNFRNNTSIYAPGTFHKDRFTNGVLLPSQRFQRSVLPMSILEQPKNIDTDSDIDDIFSDRSKTQTMCRKRSIDCVDKVSLPNQKKARVSPCKSFIHTKAKGTEEKTVNNNKPNEFVFAKPIMPVRKTFNFKSKEKLISKSVAPISETIEPVIIAPTEQNKLQPKACVEPYTEKNKLPETNVAKDNEIEEEPANITAQTDISEKPSFRKRKLFSQKLDIADQKNVSTDKLVMDSPQNSGYSAILKEKHKVRKLQQAKTQSCMSRDVVQDDSNLLDLIYKIVPPDQMNVTNRSNKTVLQNSSNKTEDSEDKWDITSIISTRHNDDESDTYTDEEIFNLTVKETDNRHQEHQNKIKKQEQQNITKQQNKSKEKKEQNKDREQEQQNKAYAQSKDKERQKEDNEEKQQNKPKEHEQQKANEQNEVPKKAEAKVVIQGIPSKTMTCMLNGDALSLNTQKCVKSFWDTDVESDAECLQPHRNGHTFNNNETHNNNRQERLHSPETSVFRGFSARFNSTKLSNSETAKGSLFSNTCDRLKQFNATLGIASHRAPKRKEHDITKDETLKPVIFEPKHVKQKTSIVQKKSDDKSELPSKKIKILHQTKINEQIDKTLKPTSEQIKTQSKGSKQNQKDAVSGQNKQNQSKNDKNIKKKSHNSKNSSLQEPPQNESSTKVINKEQAKNNSEVKNTGSSKKKATNTKPSLMTPTKNGVNSKITNKENVETKANSQNKNSKTQPNKLKQSSDKKQSPDNKKDAEIQRKKLKDLNDNKSNKRQSPRNKKVKDIEENKNKSDRSIRSCRMRKINLTLDDSFSSFDGTMCRSLRSRDVVIISPASSPLFTKIRPKRSCSRTPLKLSSKYI